MRILVLGAGFGGLQLSTRLSEELGGDADVVLIDRTDAFVPGFSKLDVMFGRAGIDTVRHPYRDIDRPGVRFVPASIEAIDPVARRVDTSAGRFSGDVMVVALGADLDADATPGLLRAGHDFYTEERAFAVRGALEAFTGGHAVIGVTSTPFKCPPAPSETALMLHDYLTARGLRGASEISLVMPLGSPIPPSPEASAAILRAFERRGIRWHPNRTMQRLDPTRRVAVFADGDEMPFDLFLGVPRHRAPAVVAESGLCVDGWVPVDPRTMQTRYPDVYAVGDVTSAGTPKAGSFSERAADVVADHLIARHRGAAATSTYDGMGVCYMEFGREQVARVEVAFPAGQPPTGRFDEPSAALLLDKAHTGEERIRRWFGR